MALVRQTILRAAGKISGKKSSKTVEIGKNWQIFRA
jgi:hypothetical protein